jgi:ribosomal-protein-alanine N-acetyltransferase
VSQPPVYVLRAMHYDDVLQVVAIDRWSFPLPWSANTYRYEIGHHPASTMVTLCLAEAHDAPGHEADSSSRRRLSGLWDRLAGRPHANSTPTVVGYGGFWLSQRRAHISTVAVHPDHRGHGLGELVIAGMIRRAMAQQALLVTLEVRVSNAPAIALYHKYEFASFGVKHHYYRDNGEDAYDMRVAPVDEAYRIRFEARWAALRTRLSFIDRLTETAPPETHF